MNILTSLLLQNDAHTLSDQKPYIKPKAKDEKLSELKGPLKDTFHADTGSVLRTSVKNIPHDDHVGLDHHIETNRFPKKRSVMEFMYCIPDLEVFIDETVKKCLLEYDLDSKDTEAVLDDLEKTWPPDSPKVTGKRLLNGARNVFKDCNDNNTVDRAKEGIHQQYDNHVVSNSVDRGLAAQNGDVRRDSKRGDFHINGRVSQDESDNSPGKWLKLSPGRQSPSAKQQETLQSRGSPWRESRGSPGARSDTNSPDGYRDSRSPPLGKHAKLKSRLQQRYFEDKQDTTDNFTTSRNNSSSSSSSNNNNNKTHHQLTSFDKSVDGASGSSSPQLDFTGNNLDLLARAANMHTAALRAKQMTSAQKPGAGDDVSYLPKDRQFTQRSYTQEWISSQNLSSGRDERLDQSKLPTSTVSHPSRQETRVRAEHYPRDNIDSSALSNDNSHSIYTNRPLISNQQSLRQTGNEIAAVGSDPDLNRRAKLLLQHYQNGYHSVIPRDSLAMQRGNQNQRVDRMPLSDHGHHPKPLITDHGQGVPNSGSKVFLVVNQESSAPRGTVAYSDRQQHIVQKPSQTDACFFDNLQGSRIATIIAEELQKDDESQTVELTQSSTEPNRFLTQRSTVPYLQRMMSDEPSLRQRSRTPGYHHSYSSPADVPVSSIKNVWNVDSTQQNSLNRQVILLPQETAKVPRSINVPSFLPSHPSLLQPAHASKVATMSAHLSPIPRASPSSDRRSHFAGSRHGEIAQTSPDDQPEDLSMNSRKRKFAQTGIPSIMPTSSLDSPGTAGYFSSPTSPEVSWSRYRTVGSPSARKSTSPSNNSDWECDYSSNTERPRSVLRASGQWERRGHVHGLDLVKTTPLDNKILVERQRLGVVSNLNDV